MTDPSATAGLVVLGVFLLLVIIAFVVVVFFVIKKLKFQHKEILELNERIDSLKSAEQGDVTVETDRDVVVSRTKPKGEMRADSAVDMCDTYSLSTHGNSVHGNDITQDHCPVSIKPQYTIKIKNRHTLMFGPRTAMPQMVALTQDFSRGDEDIDAVTSVDDIDIESVDESDTVGTLTPLSRQSIWQGRPTSFLMQTPSATPDTTSKALSHDKGVFVHKSIGKDGDIIKMSGVTLEIPPGALDESKLITLGVTWDEALLPELKKKQARLSPVIVCQPCIQFTKPVKLTFPHCGVKIISDWIPRVIKRQGSVDDTGSEWTNLTLDDYEERDVTDSEVTVSLKHFTLYTLIGESKQGKTAAKKVKLIAFTPTLQLGAMFKTRIYCINDYEKEIKEVDEVENKLDGSMSNAPVPLLFHDNGEDLTVTLKKDTREWNLCGDKLQYMDFESVWHAMTPYCNFVFEPSAPANNKIYCEFESLQQTVGRKVSLQISAEHVAPVNKLSPYMDPRQELNRKLIILLDPKTSSDAGDFRDLASKMNLDGAHVTYLESQTNPTEQLLKQWQDDKRSLHELKKVLLEINRLDAAEEVELYMSKYLTSD
ncbi:netrin receptor UNC5B-like [Pecten maximus]|uniref:netrin receptor UNC5B-like n=1 Tax=Pecten maximus TaxID=6579 RepID=UPI00145900CE|nr:netrin receptor UNC5B-like [Pecten maximus]XP_033736200.1 netrin receptor UNC5B-like [Pecten maximus]